MNITIVGGGNIGTLLAAECAKRNNSVTVYTSKPEKWQKELTVLDSKDNILFSSEIKEATDDPEKAFSQCDFIIITLPPFAFEDFAKVIYPYIKENMILAVIPGSGGAEFVFEEHIKKGCILAGLQRVHCIARIEEYGKSVRALGYKNEIHIAVMPNRNTNIIQDLMTSVFNMPCSIMPNYLSVTLTPSNPILHTTRLCTMFEKYKPGDIFQDQILFYEEWDNRASELLFKCDEELQQICAAMSEMDLSNVISLKKHYESETPELLTKKIRSIEAFKSITAPMIKCKDGFIPDFNSRYFTSDFRFGLYIIKEFAEITGVSAPYINSTINWYKKFDDSKPRRILNNYSDINKIYKLYFI